MQLTYLAFIDADGREQTYDLTEGALKCKDADGFLYGLECALFGAESLFAGSSRLSAMCGEDTCEAVRDFEKNTLSVTVNGQLLMDDDAEKTMAKLAVFKREQWKESVIADGVGFIDEVQQNTDGFLTKFFAYLGIDEEELNSRYQDYDNRLALLNAQIDALRELCDGNETVVLHLDNLKTREKQLLQQLDSVRASASLQENNENIERAALHAETCKTALSDSESARFLVHRILEYREIASGLRSLEEALADCVESLKKEQNVLTLMETCVLDITKERALSTAETQRVRDTLEDLCRRTENAVLGREADANVNLSGTDTVAPIALTDKGSEESANADLSDPHTSPSSLSNNQEALLTQARATFDEVKEIFIRISENREKDLPATFRKAVRESGILDAVIAEKTVQKETLTALHAETQQENTVLSREIDSCEQAMNPLAHDDGDEELKETRRQRYFRSKIICDMLNGDISAANAKIVTNLEARKTYSEDADALQKARLTLKEYVKRCEERRDKINEKRIGIKAKLAYCKGVDEMEYGSVCPVCQGRVTDKSELSAENAKLQTTLAKYNDELNVNGSILHEYRDKLEKIDARLGRLTERDSLSQSYIESLTASILQKKKKIADFLKLCNAKSTEELDKIVDAALTLDKDGLMAVQSGEAVVNLLRSQTDFLMERKVANEKYLSALSAEIANVSAQITELQAVVQTELLPYMDGKTVSESTEILTKTEVEEEEERQALFACCKALQETADAVLSSAEREKVQIIRLFRDTAQSLFTHDMETPSANLVMIDDFVATQRVKVAELSQRITEMETEQASLSQKMQEIRALLEGAEDVDDAVLDELRDRILDEEMARAYQKIVDAQASAQNLALEEENGDAVTATLSDVAEVESEPLSHGLNTASVGCVAPNDTSTLTDKNNAFYAETQDLSSNDEVQQSSSNDEVAINTESPDGTGSADNLPNDMMTESSANTVLTDVRNTMSETDDSTTAMETAVNTDGLTTVMETTINDDIHLEKSEDDSSTVAETVINTDDMSTVAEIAVNADDSTTITDGDYPNERSLTTGEDEEMNAELSEDDIHSALTETAAEICALQEKITVIRAAESAIARKQRGKDRLLTHFHNVQALLNREGSVLFVQAADTLLSAFDARLSVKLSGHETVVYRNDKPLLNADEDTENLVLIAYNYALNQLLRSASDADTMRVVTLHSGGNIAKRGALPLSLAQHITVLYS